MAIEKGFLGLAACLMLLDAGCAPKQAIDEPLGTAQAAVTSVTWFDVVGASARGNSITKTGAPGWNAGGATNETLAADGYFEFTTAENDTDKVAGISYADPAGNYAAIDFGIDLTSGGLVHVFEDGSERTGIWAYAAGDVFRIQVTGTTVTYLRNGSLLYTSTQPPASPLLFGTSLYTTGATVDSVVLSASFWHDPVGVSTSGQSMTKTGAPGWNAGAASVSTLSGNGYAQFTTAESHTDKVAGLSHADPAGNYASIDFGIDLTSGGTVNVYEDGIDRASLGTYAAGDVFQIQVNGAQVIYLQNGSLLYTSTQTPTLPLLFGTSLYTTGATVDNVVLSDFWQDPVGVSTSGQSMTKTGAPGWNAGAASVSTLTGNGYAQLTTAESNTDKVVGLSHADPAGNYAAIDFGIDLTSGGGVAVYEDGIERASLGTYAAGDVFQIQVNGAQVTYLQNGSLLYTSTQTPTLPLLFGTSLYATGATVDGVVLSASFWQDMLGVTTWGQSMTKTGAAGWNAGAASVSTLTGNGYAQLTTAESNTDKVVGLSHADPAGNYAAIDFGIDLTSGGGVAVYEDGIERASLGTYAAGDVFQIQVTGTTVTYLQNGSLLYTSTQTPTLPLLFGASLYTTGATVDNVVLVNAAMPASLKLGAISAGGDYTCAVTTAGGALCWGYSTTTNSKVPVAVSGLSSGAASISSGSDHTCAVTTAGGALCWGENQYGELGNDSTSNSLVPAAVSGLSSGVAAISAGTNHTCALTTAGGVLCWGFNAEGQLGNDSTSNSLVPVAVSGLSSGVAAISAGTDHNCALTTAGGVLCWGYNDFGQLGNNATTESLVPVAVSGLSSGVAAISAGDDYTCAVTTAGGVLCWGQNREGQLGNNSTTNSKVPVAVSGLSSGVAAIFAGSYHTCAVTTAGGALCWGDNDFGQLGNDSTTQSNVPVAVSGLSSGVAVISAGSYHTCAVTTAGGGLCWGDDDLGQLGNDSTTSSPVPVSIDPP